MQLPVCFFSDILGTESLAVNWQARFNGKRDQEARGQ